MDFKLTSLSFPLSSSFDFLARQKKKPSGIDDGSTLLVCNPLALTQDRRSTNDDPLFSDLKQ